MIEAKRLKNEIKAKISRPLNSIPIFLFDEAYGKTDCGIVVEDGRVTDIAE